MNHRLLLLGFIVFTFSSLSPSRAGDFSLWVSKFNTREALQVGRDWRTDIPDCLKVSLRSSRPISGKDMYFKAYFFDEEGNLLRAQTGPNAIWTSDRKGGTIKYQVPESFKPGQVEVVYLALPEDVKKMKNVVIVFGQGSDLIFDVYPKTKKIEEFSIPEKQPAQNILKNPVNYFFPSK